jgi:hypothetical protein
MATDPLKSRAIHIGGQTRNIKMTMTALRVLQKRYNGAPVRDIVRNPDIDQICEMAAAGLLHEDRTISADTVAKWLDNEPQMMPKLAAIVVECIGDAYSRMSPPKAKSGEGDAPVSTPGLDETTMAVDAMTTADGLTSG